MSGRASTSRPSKRAHSTARVLHIVESFDNQAIENWLLRAWRVVKTRQPSVEWSFFCTERESFSGKQEAIESGAVIIHSEHSLANKRSFLSGLRRVIRDNRYDILHCHHDVMSALPLLASAGLPLRRRIVHVHNTTLSLPTGNSFKKVLLREPMRQICLRGADRVVGVSQEALAAMLGGRPTRAGRDEVIHCGIETEQFRKPLSVRHTLRTSLGLAENAKILLFVGRMTTYKNPVYVVEMLAQLVREDDTLVAVFAGRGPLETAVLEEADGMGLQNRVKVLGWREDVPDLMAASDCLIWPGVEEPKEGLGLGIVEAQAAGLRVLMSRNVPAEAVVIPELVRILSLSLGAAAWAGAVLDLMGKIVLSKAEALLEVEASSFDLTRSTNRMIELYDDLRPGAPLPEQGAI